MISGATEEELDIANDRADLLLEIERLNNIINELERYIIEQETINNGAMQCGISSDSEIEQMGIENDIYDLILDKLQELKGDDK